MVLGVIWLATLGPRTSDYINRLFEFNMDGKHICWVGDPCSVPSQVNISTLRRFSKTDSISYLLRLEIPSQGADLCSQYSPDLLSVLDNYNDIFQPFNSLPPS